MKRKKSNEKKTSKISTISGMKAKAAKKRNAYRA